MIFRVIWRRALLGRLADFFLKARDLGLDPNAITAAVARIDMSLAKSPSTCGESRPGGERILIELPLAVDFEIFDDEKVVVVVRVRYVPPRSA